MPEVDDEIDSANTSSDMDDIPIIKMGDKSTNEIPAKYCDPAILKDESGKRTGCRIMDILSFEMSEAVNLYSFKNNVFRFYYTENDASCD